jgi:hypothetical protein
MRKTLKTKKTKAPTAKSSGARPLTYTRLMVSKGLLCGCRTLPEMADALQAAADEFRAMASAGVQVETPDGVWFDFSTDDPTVATRFGFEDAWVQLGDDDAESLAEVLTERVDKAYHRRSPGQDTGRWHSLVFEPNGDATVTIGSGERPLARYRWNARTDKIRLLPASRE